MHSWMNDVYVNGGCLATGEGTTEKNLTSYLVPGNSGTLCVKENPVKRPSSQGFL